MLMVCIPKEKVLTAPILMEGNWDDGLVSLSTPYCAKKGDARRICPMCLVSIILLPYGDIIIIFRAL